MFEDPGKNVYLCTKFIAEAAINRFYKSRCFEKYWKKTLALWQIISFTDDLQEFFQYFKQKDIIFLRFKEHLHTVFPLI